MVRKGVKDLVYIDLMYFSMIAVPILSSCFKLNLLPQFSQFGKYKEQVLPVKFYANNCLSFLCLKI